MNNELSIKVSATMDKALKSIDKLIPKINETDSSITRMLLHMDKSGQITGFTAELKKLDNEMEKITKNSINFKNALNLGATMAFTKKLFNSLTSWTQSSVDYSESLNLFNVVLDESISKGMKFQNVMNEAFGTNQSETLTRQGLYQSMAENMGIAQEYAYIMSETSTKLVNDIASLYNKDEDTVAEAIRAGVYAGQTKPLRSFGMDITEKTLQPELDRLGINRTVRDLNQAEKQLLRYISILRQSQEAQGDWANTIEAPANQLKILKNQLVEAQKALANLFIGSFAKILPYANAILMVIEEISNAIATMFGIEISDYNTSIAGFGDAFADVEDTINDTTGALKELKRQTLGFDQINNLTTNNGSSGTGAETSGGIDKRLLDAITSYDNGMESVRMKALQIRDNIMQWLGFTKEINPLTGKVSFKYKGIKETLINIWKSFKGLNTTAKIFVGIGLALTAQKLFTSLKKTTTILGGTGLFKVLGNLISPTKTLLSYMKTGVKENGNLVSGMKEGIIQWKQENMLIKDSTGQINVFRSAINITTQAMKGLLIAGAGLSTLSSSMESLSDNGANLANVMGIVAGSLGTITGLAQVGSMFGPVGTLIGGIAGGLLDLYTIYMKWPTSTTVMASELEKQTESLKQFNKELDEQQRVINEKLSSNLSLTTAHEKLIEELNSIVDANGRVKEGYEGRASFILNEMSSAYGVEGKLVDGIISNYDEYLQIIKRTIEEKKAEYLLEAKKEEYINALKNQTTISYQLTKAEEAERVANNKLLEAKENLAKKEEELNFARVTNNSGATIKLGIEIRKQKKGIEELEDKYSKALTTYKDTVTKWNNTTKALSDYETIYTAIRTGNIEQMQQAYDNATNTIIVNGKTIVLTLSDNLAMEKRLLDDKKKAYYSNANNITKQELEEQEKRYNNLVLSLANDINAVKQITPEQAEAWKNLAETDKDKFLEAFKHLLPEMQTEVIDKMENKGVLISQQLQKGISTINPTIEIKANTSNAENNISSFLKRIKVMLGGGKLSFGGGGGGGRAEGGIYAGGKWHNIIQYADGGLPDIGQMFIAREKGPELVGQIGNHTAVMNNMQIVDSVKAGVYEAVASAMSQYGGGTSVDINVRAEEGIIVEKAVNGIQNYVIKTGELPFTVPM